MTVRYPGLIGTVHDPEPAPVVRRVKPQPWSLGRRIVLLFGALSLAAVLAMWAGHVIHGLVMSTLAG